MKDKFRIYIILSHILVITIYFAFKYVVNIQGNNLKYQKAI